MAKPLDYESRVPPERRELPDPLGLEAERGAAVPTAPQRPMVAVPAAFDALLVRTADHGALQGIEAALRRLKIECFRDDDGTVAGRVVGLWVRGSHLEKAIDVRDGVLTRRAKFHAYPRQRVDPGSTPPTTMGGSFGGYF